MEYYTVDFHRVSIMPEHQQTQKSIGTKTTFQKQITLAKQTPISNPMAIIQSARINSKSLTHADVIQLQRTVGNRAVGKLLSEIGLIPSKDKQTLPVQMQKIFEEEEEPLQGKMAEAIQLQEKPEEEELLQAKMIGIIQRQEILEEEKPLQGKFEKSETEACSSYSIPLIQKQEENRTGMPDNLKDGIESLSGIDMSDVRIHFNSSRPAEVGALAYTQGTNIHVSPGQEQHLPHEAWHVVQQKQGRVRPTIQLMNGESGNDDAELERESDVMGKRAAVIYHPESRTNYINVPHNIVQLQNNNIIQCSAIDELTRQVNAAYEQKNNYYPAFGRGSAPKAWIVRNPFIVPKRATFHHIICKETLLQYLKRFGWINVNLKDAINPENYEDEENFQAIQQAVIDTYASINHFFTAIQFDFNAKNYLWRPGNVFSGINLENRADNPADGVNEPIKPISFPQQDWDNVNIWPNSLIHLASFNIPQITNANVIEILGEIQRLLNTALRCTNAVAGEIEQPHSTNEPDWEIADPGRSLYRLRHS